MLHIFVGCFGVERTKPPCAGRVTRLDMVSLGKFPEAAAKTILDDFVRTVGVSLQFVMGARLFPNL
jgi:hypothetical protein